MVGSGEIEENLNKNYEKLAYIYDHLTKDFDYLGLLNYVVSKTAINVSGAKVLDLCCGTGTVSIMLSRLGASVTGVDKSVEMISLAKGKAKAMALGKFGPKFKSGNALDGKWFEHEPFDLTVCTYDSLNYFGPKDIPQVFSRIAIALRPGGWFVFDVNSAYKLCDVFGNSQYCESQESYALIWRNKLYARSHIEFDIELFTQFPTSRGSYCRHREMHTQYIHEVQEIKSQLESHGFRVAQIGDDYQDCPATEKSMRLTFVAQKC